MVESLPSSSASSCITTTSSATTKHFSFSFVWDTRCSPVATQTLVSPEVLLFAAYRCRSIIVSSGLALWINFHGRWMNGGRGAVWCATKFKVAARYPSELGFYRSKNLEFQTPKSTAVWCQTRGCNFFITEFWRVMKDFPEGGLFNIRFDLRSIILGLFKYVLTGTSLSRWELRAFH